MRSALDHARRRNRLPRCQPRCSQHVSLTVAAGKPNRRRRPERRRARRRCCACSPGSRSRSGGRVGGCPRDLSVGYLPQELDARSNETAARGTSSAERERPRRVWPSIAAELGARGSDSNAKSKRSPAVRRHERGWPRSCWRATIVYCLDEPTNDLDFDGLERLERFVGSVRRQRRRRLARPRLPRPDGRADHRARGGQTARCASGRAAGASTRPRGTTRASCSTAASKTHEERRRRARRTLLPSVAARPTVASSASERAAPTGVAHRRSRSKVRQAERALERLEDVEKPFEPWELRLELEPAARGGDLVVRLERRGGRARRFRLGPLDLELGAATASHRPGGTGAARRRCSAR